MFPLPTLSPNDANSEQHIRVSYYYLWTMYVRIMCGSNRIYLPSIAQRDRNHLQITNYEKPMSLVALEERAVCCGRFGASYRNFTEILPAFYDFLPWLLYTSLPMRSHQSQAIANVPMAGTGAMVGWSCIGHVVSRRAMYCPCVSCGAVLGAAKPAEASAGEEEHIRARIEVVGQDNYSSRTEQRRKELCQIRWYTDRKQETASIGVVSGQGC